MRLRHWWGAAVLAVGVAGCTGHPPARPALTFYLHPEPLMVPQEPVSRPGSVRKIQPPPVPVPVCMTDHEYQALVDYLDEVDVHLKRQPRP